MRQSVTFLLTKVQLVAENLSQKTYSLSVEIENEEAVFEFK